MEAHATRHDTTVRQRKGLWTATCTCGWRRQAMSAFTAWSATRRHRTDTGSDDAPQAAPRRRVAVRLLTDD